MAGDSNSAAAFEDITPTSGPSTARSCLGGLFTHVSPRILAALTLGFLIARIALGNWHAADLIAPLSLVAIWPLLEWTIHVFLLHWRPIKLWHWTLDPRVARKHRQHHVNPSDLTDITIDRQVFHFAVPAIVGLFFWLMPTPALATGALAAFFALSLHYEFCHFMAHTNWCPPLNYYRRRQRMHRLHHHRDEKLWWGVSMGLGDWIMGTAPDLRSVERSSTVRDVHGLLRQRGESAP
jgi:hypothetical protein